MKRLGKRALAVGIGIATLVAGAVLTFDTVDGAAHRKVLKSDNMTGLRHEALTLFPRGSRLSDVTARLVELGFVCEPLKRSIGDISGPALLCASNGRGYPDYPAINVTVSTRNDLVSEIEVWNLIARSDDLSLGSSSADKPETNF